MTINAHERITQLLETSARDPRAAEELLPLVYQELRQVASSRMRHLPPGNTLEPTALVHEAYLRVSGSNQSWESRNQFFVAVARSMRNILVDAARRKARIKHGGDRQREEFDPALGFVTPPSSDVLAVHEAIEVLEA
ncbi:MAG: ECF-type sigma factor, partial [Planctomycetota bacterium]